MDVKRHTSVLQLASNIFRKDIFFKNTYFPEVSLHKKL